MFAATASLKPAATMRGAHLIAACTIGNALEFYDFVIFSFFAATIGKLFFPVQDPGSQILLALATYGVGFILRPIGGAILGSYADKHGRKTATLLTLLLMAIGTGMIGLAPTYGQVGLWGPLIVLVGRLIQGFSAGGEVGASTTLLAEYAPGRQRAFYGSWQLASQGLGILVAALVVWTIAVSLSAASTEAWGWRLPFLLGVLILPVGLWLRSALKETHANQNTKSFAEISAVKLVFRKHSKDLLKGVALIIGATASNAVIILYMATYAVRQLGLPVASGLFSGVIAGVVLLIAAPIGGMLSDRYGRKPVGCVFSLVLTLTIYPAFLFLTAHPSLPTLLATVFFLSTLFAAGNGATFVMLTEIFPIEVRASGTSLVYAFGVAIFGGFGQFIVTWLIQFTGDPIAPAYYVAVCCALSTITLILVPETAKQQWT